MALYVKYVMTSVNYKNKVFLRLTTCKEYVLDVAKLFNIKGCPSTVNVMNLIGLELSPII